MMIRSILITSAAAGVLYAGGIESAFKEASHTGYLRLGYQHQNQEKSYNTLAVGGKLGMLTAPVAGVRAGVVFYTTDSMINDKHMGIERQNFGVPFYDNENHNYTLLGEVYLQAEYHDSTLTIGRQVVDTPFVNSDDIGMVPNLYEAYMLSNHSLKDTTLILSHVTKWAGVDAPQHDTFTKVNQDTGLQMLGMIYEGIERTSLSAWYYHAEDLADILYLEGGYEGDFQAVNYSLGIQYALEDFTGSEKAAVYGMTGEVSLPQNGITLSLSYNRTDSTGAVAADNFFGGGPFYAASEHLTIAEAGINGKGVMGGISIDGSQYGAEGITLSLTHLYLKGDDAKADETDFLVSWSPSDKMTIDLIYSDADNHLDSTESFQNLRFFANYHF
jgi:hypothetical protein